MERSAVEYMLYHQKIFAQRSPGRVRCAVSQTFSPLIRWFDWRQSQTSERSRKYQPFATMPCSRGIVPVSIVACAVHVTAGSTGVMGAMKPSLASACRCGVSSPIREGVKPTMSRTTSGAVMKELPVETG